MSMWWSKPPVEMISVPKADWLALNDAVQAERASRVLDPASSAPAWVRERQQLPSQAFTEAQIELILHAHYRDVLGSKEGRKVWRKLLSDAATVERMAKVGH